MSLLDQLSIQEEIIEAGKCLWHKNLVTGYNGNLSRRKSAEEFCISGTKTALGYLTKDRLSFLNLDGVILKGAEPSSELGIHLAIYKAFSNVVCVVHTHTPFINGYFMDHSSFEGDTFEAKMYLGKVDGVEQTGPNVVSFSPVVDALKRVPIVALRQHGVIAIGESFFDAIALIQYLEESIQTVLIRRQFKNCSE